VSFCDAEEKEYLRDIQKLIRQTIPLEPEHQFIGKTDIEVRDIAEIQPVIRRDIHQTQTRPFSRSQKTARFYSNITSEKMLSKTISGTSGNRPSGTQEKQLRIKRIIHLKRS
jgi:ATP-dependent RNA helicase RhlE